MWPTVYDWCLKFCFVCHPGHWGTEFGVRLIFKFICSNRKLQRSLWLLRHSIHTDQTWVYGFTEFFFFFFFFVTLKCHGAVVDVGLNMSIGINRHIQNWALWQGRNHHDWMEVSRRRDQTIPFFLRLQFVLFASRKLSKDQSFVLGSYDKYAGCILAPRWTCRLVPIGMFDQGPTQAEAKKKKRKKKEDKLAVSFRQREKLKRGFKPCSSQWAPSQYTDLDLILV